MKNGILYTVVLVVLVLLVLNGRKPTIVQWEHSGDNVKRWEVCAPSCEPVTPKVVGMTGRTLRYRVVLPRRSKTVTVKACNAAGCGEAVAK